jgi:hypothetical protein
LFPQGKKGIDTTDERGYSGIRSLGEPGKPGKFPGRYAEIIIPYRIRNYKKKKRSNRVIA